jgi:peptide/nickel transport system substrate-binding protein
MSLAINRDEVNEALFLGLTTPEQALPQNVPFVTEADKKFMAAYDPKGANKFLDEMGLKRGTDGIRLRPDGKKLTVLWEYTLQYVWSPEFPALIADYWRAVGVNVLLKEVALRTDFAFTTGELCSSLLFSLADYGTALAGLADQRW